MRFYEFDIKTKESGPASRSLCLSKKRLGASDQSSCVSQGLRPHKGEKSHLMGTTRVKVAGKKIKGKKYGGPLPDWGSHKK